MSRDAKIGLAIVLTFGCLFGTVLVHRLHRTTADGVAATESPAVAVDDGTPVGAPDSIDNDQTAATVDAVPAETFRPSFSDPSLRQASAPGFAPETYSNTRSSSMQPPPELPLGTSGQIVLTDPQSGRSPAAVVDQPSETGADFRSTDSGSPVAGNLRSGRSPHDAPDAPGYVADSPTGGNLQGSNASGNIEFNQVTRAPSMELRQPAERLNSAPGGFHDDEPPTTPSAPDTPNARAGEFPTRESEAYRSAEVTNLTPTEPATGRNSFMQLEAAPDAGQAEIVETEEPDQITPDADIHQTAGGRTNDRTAPPSYTDAQPIIEPLPDRGPSGARRPIDNSFSPSRMTQGDNLSHTTDQADARSRADADINHVINEPARHEPTHDASFDKTYVVQPGDSFWSISARFYRTGKYFRELERYNLDRMPHSDDGGTSDGSPSDTRKHLVPGMTVYLPDESVLRVPRRVESPAKSVAATSSRLPSREDSVVAAAPASAAPGTYRVRQGESLSTIAQRVLGSSKRWEEIYHLNRDLLEDPHQVRAGMELKMPSGRETEKIADRPGSGR